MEDKKEKPARFLNAQFEWAVPNRPDIPPIPATMSDEEMKLWLKFNGWPVANSEK